MTQAEMDRILACRNLARIGAIAAMPAPTDAEAMDFVDTILKDGLRARRSGPNEYTIWKAP